MQKAKEYYGIKCLQFNNNLLQSLSKALLHHLSVYIVYGITYSTKSAKYEITFNRLLLLVADNKFGRRSIFKSMQHSIFERE